jgi:hypothetical protein
VTNETTITVPVLADFDTNRVVGFLTLNKEALPPTPAWHIALGFVAEAWTDQAEVTKYELKCVAVLPDERYKAWDESYGAKLARLNAALDNFCPGAVVVERAGQLIVGLP